MPRLKFEAKEKFYNASIYEAGICVCPKEDLSQDWNKEEGELNKWKVEFMVIILQ